MIKEYDVVFATKDLSSKVKKNCLGTVLIKYEGNNKTAFEVEFTDDNKNSLEVLTVNKDDVALQARKV